MHLFASAIPPANTATSLLIDKFPDSKSRLTKPKNDRQVPSLIFILMTSFTLELYLASSKSTPETMSKNSVESFLTCLTCQA